MYAVYHGQAGVKAIAGRMHGLATILDIELKDVILKQLNTSFLHSKLIYCRIKLLLLNYKLFYTIVSI
jgi:glycine cleavage system pyridoxal-binding protein P